MSSEARTRLIPNVHLVSDGNTAVESASVVCPALDESTGAGASDTQAIARLPIIAPIQFPKVGGEFCGFDVLTELGRGGMGRVFLATQPSMANRLVVLKVGEHLSGECEKLARLQHPNVVPVYSFHQHDKLQAVCMPYRGPLTLAHLVSRLQTENLPTLSGRALTTVIDDCRRSREQSIAVPPPAEANSLTAPVVPDAAPVVPPFAGFRGMSFVDAVLSIFWQVAEGLRFAHAERIVHSDLKPANVLIADDGCPQLIDFGIAYDQSNPSTKGLVIGGTRPYSSPEQLSSLAQAAIQHDERTDLYSVGVMMYEMVTGRLPFEPNYDPSDESIERDRAGRFTPPVPPRSLNGKVPAGVEAIITKCLAPRVEDRYQSAGELIEDLGRQLGRRPLRHAPNPSRWELTTKWASRNRWLLAAGAVLTVAGTATGSFGLYSSRQNDRLTAVEASTSADQFDLDCRRVQVALASGTNDATGWEAAIRSAEKALAGYRVLDDDRWWESGRAAKLPPDRVTQMRQRVAVLLLDLSRAAGVRSTLAGPRNDGGAWLAKARDLNRRAEQTFPDETSPRGVWTQRAWLARLAGDDMAAKEAARTANVTPLRTALDYRIEGRELLEQGQWQAADERLARAVELDPTDFWASFSHGQSQYRLGSDAQAVAAYDVCAALDPTVVGVNFNRGLAYLRLRKFEKAEADFARVIAVKDDWADPYLNRATAREALKNYPAAVADLTRAIELGYPPTAIRFARSRIYSLMGQNELAQRDLADGMKELPTDERGWITRAYARLPQDATGGLKAFQDSLDDFDQALRLNPRSAPALQSKARIYSRTGENRRAVEVLSELLDYYPETLDALSGRAMLYSRLGERAKAHADAEAAAALAGDNPRTTYQLAGVYAMTSTSHPDDKHEALRHLASALRKGYGFDLLDIDRELDPLRSTPEFSQVVEDARRVVERQPKK